MINQFTRVLVGSIILLALLAFAVPKFFPQETADDIRKPTEIVDHSSSAASSGSQSGQTAQNAGDEANAVDEYDAMDENFGYGDLLEDEGSNPPVEFTDNSVKSGVVVGVEADGANGRNGTFVANPTITGNTPAEVARMQADARRKAEAAKNSAAEQESRVRAEAERLAAEKRRIEAEKQAQQENARLEAERRAQAEATRQKAEAEARARAEAEKARAEAEKARAEAERRAREETAAAKARAEAEKNRERMASLGQVDSAPKGRYLQVGTFSTLAKANEVRNRLKAARIGVPKEYMKDIAPGFGYKVIPNNGNYTVLVGPAKNDAPFRAIKNRVDWAAGVNSFAVSK